MYSFDINTKLASLASAALNHSAHTILSTVGTGMAFGVVGMAVGFGLGIVDEILLYSNVIDHHYLTYAALTISGVSLLNASVTGAAFIADVIEKTIITTAFNSYLDYDNKDSGLVDSLIFNHNLEHYA